MSEGRNVVTGQVILTQANAPARADDDALELAVREHARLVYRIAYSVLRNHDDAEDATQETFLRVLRYRRQLAGIEDARTWLARIAWRVATGRRRKAPEMPLEDLQSIGVELPSGDAPVDVTAFDAQMGGIVRELVITLPKKLRGPILLSTLEEMSTTDIAAALKISEAAVRSRLFRARELLKEKLAARLGVAYEVR